MRLAYVCLDPGVPVFGSKGASVHVQELLRAYRRLGHDPLLIATRLGGDPPADLADIEVVELGRPEARDAGTRELAMVDLDLHAEQVLQARGGFALIHERYSLWGGAGIRAARRSEVVSVLEVNAPLIDEQREHRELVHVALAGERLSDAARGASIITTVSHPVAAWVHEQVASAAPVHVVPNGVDTTRFHPPETLRARPFTVGFVGTLKPWHGVETLVEAIALLRPRVPEVRLLLVGDGPRRAHLTALATDRGVPLHTTGAVHPAEVPALLHDMDVACAPYPAGAKAAYFSPLKVLEYLAAGVPVVASRTGQLPQLLDGGRCGVLVPPGDAPALAEALAALAASPQRRSALAAAGRAQVVARHRWEHVATTILDLAIGEVPPLQGVAS